MLKSNFPPVRENITHCPVPLLSRLRDEELKVLVSEIKSGPRAQDIKLWMSNVTPPEETASWLVGEEKGRLCIVKSVIVQINRSIGSFAILHSSELNWS